MTGFPPGEFSLTSPGTKIPGQVRPDYVDTIYDADDRIASVTNPYRSTSDPTYGITQYQYDALNRTLLRTDPDSSTVSTSYTGNCTAVTDEVLKDRQSCTDGLGRLTQVTENPGGLNYVTSYTCDALNNLASVTQNSSRQRSFVYDSVSRLLTSSNPEIASPSTGTPCAIAYSYDADGSLSTKTAPASNQLSCSTTVSTNYIYDALNRLTAKTYSNGDPSVAYTYDQSSCLSLAACANIGHRTSMTDAGGSESWAYDMVHRQSADQRTTNAVAKSTSYSYDYNGATSTLTYPDGRMVTYTFNNAAQAISAVDSAFSINYATGGTYAPPGGLSGLALGQTGSFTGINISNSYNNRLQPTRMRASSTAGTAFDLTYCFSNWVSGACQAAGGNNGNVNGITNNLNGARTQAFTYDKLNRLSTATSSSWSLAFGYDSWGNLLTAGATGTATPLNLTANTNNHITTAPFAYDAAGNETADAAGTYTWNAEGELKTAGGVTYTYDGDGRRVEKSNGNLYWYGMGAEVLEESDASGNMQEAYVFFGGKRIANRFVSSGAISYYAEDLIGSSRVIATSGGTICYDADFYPYGTENQFANTCPQNYKFTGKERDAETGNDDFGARYYSSVYGRFLSADWSAVPTPIPYANLTNPQTLNLYAIVRDNPETFADLDGHDVKDYLLLSSGPNNVPNTPHPEVPDVSTLGPKETSRGVYLALNTQATFDEGDNPADYKPLRTAYILRNEGDVLQMRTGAEENPSKSQIANTGSSQFVFDSPGASVSGAPRSALNGKLDIAFSFSEKNTKTGQVSQKQFFYRVTILVKAGKIVGYRAIPISQKEFQHITGQDKERDKKKRNQ